VPRQKFNGTAALTKGHLSDPATVEELEGAPQVQLR
jgi:hypothetical protein